ncbi:MAG: hypothetical protein BMS9Abin02_1138 [Anaerolineae bacterium]|nr:MAG: hypothetical protein BMS9Abin02_1138 [Anaerolineae bacterium]
MGWIELANELEAAHQHFMQITTQLTPVIREKKGACGEWSPKDIVAHLVGWDTEAVYFLGLFANGTGDTYDYSFDIDDFNASSVKSREKLSWDEVIHELVHAHAELQQIIKVLNTKDLVSNGGFGESLTGRKEDYLLHAEQIAVWLSTAGS